MFFNINVGMMSKLMYNMCLMTLSITASACIWCCKGYLQHWRSCCQNISSTFNIGGVWVCTACYQSVLVVHTCSTLCTILVTHGIQLSLKILSILYMLTIYVQFSSVRVPTIWGSFLHRGTGHRSSRAKSQLLDWQSITQWPGRFDPEIFLNWYN